MRWLFSILREEAGGGDAGGGASAAAPAPAGGSTLLAGGAPGGDSSAPAPVGGSDGPWNSKLPDIYRNESALVAFTGFEEKDLIPVPREFLEKVGGSYKETKSMIGKKFEIPNERSTPEQIAAFRKTAGIPETPEGYFGDAKTLRPESVPEGMWDQGTERKFLETVALKHNLTPAAVKDIFGFQGESIGQAFAQSAEAEAAHLQQQKAELQKSWGNDFDTNLTLASRVAKTVGLDPDTNTIFQSAEVVQAFAKLGKLFNETSLVKGEASSSASGGITARISEIQDPKSEALAAREYRGEFGPERQQAAAEMLRGLLKAQGPKK